jgi:type III secretion protein W
MAAASSGAEADRLMGRLLELTEQSWINSSQVSAALGELRLQPIEAEIYLLRELADIVRAFPLKMFAELDRRERLIDAVQQALDEAIEREEQAL